MSNEKSKSRLEELKGQKQELANKGAFLQQELQRIAQELIELDGRIKERELLEKDKE